MKARSNRRVARKWALVLLGALTGAAAFGGSASAAVPSLYWGYPSVIDSGGSLSALSCPSSSFCVGTDLNGNVLTSTDPTAGAGAWTRTSIDASPTPYLYSVSCPQPAGSLCVAIGAGGIFVSSHPTHGAGSWKHFQSLGAGGRSVSCTFDDSLCVAAGSTAGELLVSQAPTEVGSWTPVHLAGAGEVTGVSCPSQSLCLAAAEGGELLTSTDPAGGAGAWTSATISGGAISKLACASPSLCVGVGGESILASSDPAAGASTWTERRAPSSQSQLSEVACAPNGPCIASGFNGTIVESSEPDGGPEAWTTESELDGHNSLGAIACPSQSLCLAADEALLVGIAAKELSVSVKGLGTVRSTRAACPFGCTYSGPVCPRNCTPPLMFNAVVPERPPAAFCAANAISNGADIGTCAVALPAGDTVTLTAEPERGSAFTGWSGACSGPSPCTLNMGSARSVIASFARPSPLGGCSCQRLRLAIYAFRQTHSRWRERRSARATHGGPAPVGTSFSFRVSQRASLTFSFTRLSAGRRLGHRCLAGTRARRMRACTLRSPAGAIKLESGPGREQLRFDGEVARLTQLHALAPGTYAVVLTAVAGAERVRTRAFEFTIVQ